MPRGSSSKIRLIRILIPNLSCINRITWTCPSRRKETWWAGRWRWTSTSQMSLNLTNQTWCCGLRISLVRVTFKNGRASYNNRLINKYVIPSSRWVVKKAGNNTRTSSTRQTWIFPCTLYLPVKMPRVTSTSSSKMLADSSWITKTGNRCKWCRASRLTPASLDSAANT